MANAIRFRGLGSLLVLMLGLSLLTVGGAVGDEAGAAVPDPTVTGPIGDAGIRGHALWDSWYDLSEVGYTEDEYFVSGSAQHATSGATADYVSRIIVFRPSEEADFNGTVMLDWVNVTAQFENAVEILSGRELLLREGWAFVHVSAQAAGICCTPLTPKAWDPVRYADLDHPGDGYADSMFSQIAKAVRAPVGVDPMDGLDVERVLAAGQSQSANRLRGYIGQEHPRAGVIDGFLVHGDTGATKDFPALDVPVLHLLSDAEAKPPEPNQTENYRLWEIAGSAHADFWIGYAQVAGQGPRYAGGVKRSAEDARELDQVAGNYGEQPHPLHGTCLVAGASFPMRYSVNAGLHHLDRWAAGGDPPPEGPRYEFNGTTLARDADGNALGGIRLPPIDVPVARYVSTSCALGGITVPFTEPELLARYATHAEYYDELRERTIDSLDAGFLLRPDAENLLERACAMRNRWLDLTSEPCEGLPAPPEPSAPGKSGERPPPHAQGRGPR